MPAIAGKVNDTLSAQMSYKGADGLTEDERRAYAVCKSLSCAHEACYKKYMFSQPAKQKEKCGPLMQTWRDCFEQELLRRSPATQG